jgi:hypothetical protein
MLCYNKMLNEIHLEELNFYVLQVVEHVVQP